MLGVETNNAAVPKVGETDNLTRGASPTPWTYGDWTHSCVLNVSVVS